MDKFLRAYMLSLNVYEDYLYCCRDGVATRKRNLDLLKAKHEEQALKREGKSAEVIKKKGAAIRS